MNHYTIYKTCKYNINKMNYEMHIIINQKKYQLQLSFKVLKIRSRWWLLLIRWWARCSNSIRWTSDEVWASFVKSCAVIKLDEIRRRKVLRRTLRWFSCRCYSSGNAQKPLCNVEIVIPVLLFVKIGVQISDDISLQSPVSSLN